MLPRAYILISYNIGTRYFAYISSAYILLKIVMYRISGEGMRLRMKHSKRFIHNKLGDRVTQPSRAQRHISCVEMFVESGILL